MDLDPLLHSLAQQGYRCTHAEVCHDGTSRVLLTDDVVVKLFTTDQQLDYDTEIASYQVLSQTDEIPAPRLLARGRVDEFDYLVLSRAPGKAVSRCSLTEEEKQRLARTLGGTIRRLHGLSVDARAGRLGRDWMRGHGSSAARRHRAWRSLPSHLIEQIDEYLLPPSGQALVHADLAVDHVFVEHGNLTCIIDWGGVELTDPHYELPVLHFDLFGCDKHQLHAFLDSYGWPDDQFVRRAMCATLSQEFDAFELLLAVRPTFVLEKFATLDTLAADLWQV